MPDVHEEFVTFCDRDSLEADYLAEFLETKRVPQNLFYLLDGADSFYTYRDADVQQIAWQDECAFFEEQPFWSPTDRYAFVSLGCGNAGPEKMLLRYLVEQGWAIHYVGVDSSQTMLDLAAENLRHERFRRTYVLADFAQPDFPERLRDLVQGFDVRLYAMIGGTFGNFEQSKIAEVLADLIAVDDYLYLDVVPLPGSQEEDDRLRARFSRLPENLRLFFDRLLASLGLSREHGEIVSVADGDDGLRSVRHTFYFEAGERITLSCLDREADLAPGERVELLSIRAYDIDSLKDFLAGWGFAFVDTCVPDVGSLSHLWQRLLFVKDRS
ncbi:MAG: class I SAM-dependent methyltransferase [Anaerolineae bacterium]